MDRRHLIKGFVAHGACLVCAAAARADEAHWGYTGQVGPDHWADLDRKNFVCSAGTQQSPVDISDAVKADMPGVAVDWRKGRCKLVNNGHTIQINTPTGSTLTRGDRTFELIQFHFHAPSEHRIAGKSFPMEAHFVHKDTKSDSFGVLGVFLRPGATNASFASLAAVFPARPGASMAADIDPSGLLPASLSYWTYEGSLTTPPCTESVEWIGKRTGGGRRCGYCSICLPLSPERTAYPFT